MSDLSTKKIRNMLAAHNDGVYLLNARDNLGEIVDFLLKLSNKMVEVLDYLLEQTIDQDLKHGVTLTEGEEDARQRALAVIANVAA